MKNNFKSVKRRGKHSQSNTSATLRTTTNVRSKRSAARDVQLPRTVEANSRVSTQNVNNIDKRTKFATMLIVLSVLLGYGMYQHDNSILFGVMVVVTAECGNGRAVEVLVKFLEARSIHPKK